jgi:hypothetical protein
MPVRNNRCFGEIAADKNSGKLKKADYDRTIRIAKEAIAREGKIRGLIIAEAFEGWERKEDWDDVSFMMEEGQHIEKNGIVGDEKWRDDALAFTAKGFRPTAIEFRRHA